MNEELSLNEVRPRFRVISPLSIEELMKKLKSRLSQGDAPCIGEVIHGHATLKIPKKDQHYWSPQLGLTFEKTEEGTLIRGLYGPRPEVWTMFVLFYSVIGFAVMVISVFGFSSWSLGKSVEFLWSVPVLILIFLSLYLVANQGKKLGKEQIHILHHFFESTIGLNS